MRWFAKGAPEIKARGSRGGTQVIRRAAAPYTAQWTPDRVMREAMDRVTWVFRCVDAIAGNQARLPLVFRQDDADTGTEIRNHPTHGVLNSESNVGENSYAFRYRMSSQLLLSSKGVFVEVVRNRVDEVIALLLLPPQYTEPDPDPKTFVKGYRVKVPNEQEAYLQPEQVIWIRKPHPFDPYKCITPLESVGVAIESDWLYKLYNRNFLLNDGRPGGLIVVKGMLGDDDKEELRSRYRGNINTVGRIGVIASDEGADFVDTAISPRDAAYIDGKKLTKEEILMGFGVPESVLSNASGRSFDNAEQERLIFWMETMNGNHLPLIARPLDKLDSDPRSFCAFDTSRVDVIQRAEIKRLDFHLKEWNQGGITENEYRAEAGRPKLAEGGNVAYIPQTYMAIGSTKKGAVEESQGVIEDGRPKPVAPKPGAGPGRPQDEPFNQDAPDPEQSRQPGERKPRVVAASANGGGAALALAEPFRHPEQVIPIRVMVDSSPTPGAPAALVKVGNWQVPEEKYLAFKEKTLNDYLRWETIYERTFQRLFERQHRVVREKVLGQKMRTWMGKREGWKGAPVVEAIFDLQAWDAQVREDTEPLLAGTMQEFSDEITAALKVMPLDVNSEVAVAARQKQLARVVLINQTTKKRIEEELYAGLDDGDDQEGLATRVDAVFDEAVNDRSRVIALTEVVAAASVGKLLAGASLSPPDGEEPVEGPAAAAPQKTWVSMGDNRVRDTHDEVDGETVGIGDTFDVGGSAMQFPGDPDGDPEEVVGCRCSLLIDGEDGPVFA